MHQIPKLLSVVFTIIGFAAAAQTCPYTTCSTSSSGYIATITNTGTGSAISATSAGSATIYGVSTGSSGSAGVYGTNTSGYGTVGLSTNSNGVRGISTNSTGVYGESTGSSAGNGVYGKSVTSTASGVYGENDTGYGVAGRALAQNGTAVYGDNTCNGSGCSGWAGNFNGRVNVVGALSKGSGSFKIDHPLDPANRYLYHSFVESPDMMNIYNGIAVLDRNGEAWVVLPPWFGALNRDFRYQLTNIGAFAPVYVAEEIVNNRFKISGGTPGGKVSWQVTGIRQDKYAQKYPVPVEEDKVGEEKGQYLHPDAFGLPETRSVNWSRRPSGADGKVPGVSTAVKAEDRR